MIDLFKQMISGGSTAGKVSGNERQKYLEYVDKQTSAGKEAVSYTEWQKGKR
jgi:hypothetical protein